MCCPVISIDFDMVLSPRPLCYQNKQGINLNVTKILYYHVLKLLAILFVKYLYCIVFIIFIIFPSQPSKFGAMKNENNFIQVSEAYNYTLI